jgi:hypothetical protein
MKNQAEMAGRSSDKREMIPLLKRHEIQVLLRAESRADVARRTGVIGEYVARRGVQPAGTEPLSPRSGPQRGLDERHTHCLCRRYTQRLYWSRDHRSTALVARRPTEGGSLRPPYRVKWEDYQRFLRLRGDHSVPRITFLEGELEIMTPSRSHESIQVGHCLPRRSVVLRAGNRIQ